ncbi:MAG: stage V sporulation protein AE [Peptococcia bacterium]|jgi:stage V sporulation protein AE
MKKGKKVIMVTDGDKIARQAVEEATRQIGGRCISASAGNPTILSGEQIVELIKITPYDPVVVMFDDRGSTKKGRGEKALEYVVNHPAIEVIGVVAVASNTENIEGTTVNCTVTKDKEVTTSQVDKEGKVISPHSFVTGDTVDVLNTLGSKVPFIVGVGDIGKMEGRDSPETGAQITTKALQLILDHWRNTRNQDGKGE